VVFEKKQLSKVLAIALMVACAVAFMPLLNGQAFAAAKKPAKVKGVKAAQVTDTMNVKVTWKKAKNAKKYQVKVGSKTYTTKKKTYTVKNLAEGTYKVKVRGVNGKKKGKWSATKTVEVKQVTPPQPIGKLEMTGFVQSGVKQLKVSFSQPITDPSALKFTVTRDGKEITFTAKADPNDQFSVLLDLDSTIVDGTDYAVAVKTADGTEVPAAAGVSTDVKGEKEKVASIEVGDILVLNSERVGGTVSYAVKNQFGEDITKTEGTAAKLNVTSTFSSQVPALDPVNKVITINNIPSPLNIAGATGTIIAVYKATGVNINKTVTVGNPAAIDAITVNGVYSAEALADGTLEEATVIANNYDDGDAVLLFQVKDQYGQAYPLENGDITPNIVGGLTNLTGTVNYAAVTIDGAKYYQIPLEAEAGKEVKAGDVTVLIVANATGKTGEYKFTVSDEDVIANLTVTAPAQVIGGADNVFTLEATNAAGTAITSYDLLKDKIKVGSGVLDPSATTDNGTWKLKKLGDGTAQLILTAEPPQGTLDKLTSETFQAVDTYKTCFITFTVLQGKGTPVAVSNVKTGTGDSTMVAPLAAVTYADVFGNTLTSGEVAAATSNYKLKVALVDTDSTVAKLVEGEVAVPGNSTYAALGTTLDGFKVVGIAKNAEHPYGIAAGKAANVKVIVSLLKKDSNGTITIDGNKYSEVINSDFTVTASVANDVIVYDKYNLYMTGDGVFDGHYKNGAAVAAADIDTVYVGEFNSDGDWKQAPLVTEFDFTVTGQMNGSSREYAVEPGSYVIEDSEKLVEQAADDSYVLTIENEDDVYGVEADTVSLYIPCKGSAAVTEKAVQFSTAEPTAAAVVGAEDLEAGDTLIDLGDVVQGGEINTSDIAAAAGGVTRERTGNNQNTVRNRANADVAAVLLTAHEGTLLDQYGVPMYETYVETWTTGNWWNPTYHAQGHYANPVAKVALESMYDSHDEPVDGKYYTEGYSGLDAFYLAFEGKDKSGTPYDCPVGAKTLNLNMTWSGLTVKIPAAINVTEIDD
jgi:hypothetical protein